MKKLLHLFYCLIYNKVYILFILFSLQCYGQNTSLQPVKLNEYNAKNGLSQNNVNVIMFDQKGFLWIGTDDGLNRFDGHSFQHFNSYTQNQLQFNSIRSLALSPIDEKIWIGTNGSLEVFDPVSKVFHREVITKEENIEDVRKVIWDKENNQFIAINNQGVFYKHSTSKTYQPLPIDIVNINNISLFDGQLYIGNKKGLRKVSYNKDVFNVSIIKQIKNATCFLPRDNSIIIGTKDGYLFEVSRNDEIKVLYKSKHSIKTITYDTNDNIWLGTEGNGVILITSDHKTVKLLHQKVSKHTINYLYRGDNDEIWLGTFGNGFLHYNDKDPFFVMSNASTYGIGLSNNSVTSIAAKNNNELWVGTDGGGLDLINIKTGEVNNKIKDKNIISLESDGNCLWVGTYKEGLFLQKKGSLRHINLKDQNNESIDNDNIWDIHVDEDQTVWLATSNGIIHYDPKKRNAYRYIENKKDYHSLSNNDCRKIYKDVKGDLWIGTFNGLNRYDKSTDSFRRFHLNKNQETGINLNNSILSLSEDENLTLWVGTFGNGLWKFDRKKDAFIPSKINHLLPNKVIYSIEIDKSNHLWLSTNKGLTMYDIKNGHLKSLSIEDGLQGMQFNVGASSAVLDSLLAFGGTDGLTIFSPKKAQLINNNSISPTITSLILTEPHQESSNIDISQEKEITLDAHQRNFAIQYVGLDYNYQHNLEYQTRIIGFDENWTTTKEHQTMMYSNFPPGKYVFQVRCRYRNGKWGETSEITLLLKAYYWETFGFKLLVLTFLCLGVYAIYVAYIKNLKKQRVILDQLVKDRSQALLAKEMDILEVKQQKADLIKDTLEVREKELTTHALRIVHLNTLIEQLDEKLSELQKNPHDFSPSKINSIRREIKRAENVEKDWEYLNGLFAEVHRPFIDMLHKKHPSLTEGNIRLCSLIKLNMSSKDIAAIMGISQNSVKVARKRLRKRLELSSEENLEVYLLNLGREN
ncbi:two-component regulator propeller domain-containing protein [Flammeovirga sp. SubArs3]|uniref:ligand-binding sensor domain-containing protein n=1 Tax=Flammeovirga sp. SubArs3 TaxID=2995316 RepID=UPI00248BB43E|nr:two-component regulator propeller domain-containing protein [Flammeovirga sp. SubArs3]